MPYYTVPLITFTLSRHKPHWFIHIDYRWSRPGVPQVASDDKAQMEGISNEILRKTLHNLGMNFTVEENILMLIFFTKILIFILKIS